MSRIEFLLSGAYRPGDAGNSWQDLPQWFDSEKFDLSRRLTHGNSCSNYFSTTIGVVLASQLPSLMEPLIETGNVCTLVGSQTRIARTFQFVLSWNEGDMLNPEDDAHKNLKKVKYMHKKIAERMNKLKPSERVWVSQLDMALTQFSIVGPIMLFPEKIGVYLSEEDLELLAYFWKTIGYMLGLEDAYNLCTGTYSEIRQLCWDIVEVIVKPSLSNPNPVYTECLRNAVVGLKKFSSFIDYAAFVNWTYELIGFDQRLPMDLYGRACMNCWKGAVNVLYYDRVRTRLSPFYRGTIHRRIKAHMNNSQDEASSLEGSFWTLVYTYVMSFIGVLKKLAVPNSLQEQ